MLVVEWGHAIKSFYVLYPLAIKTHEKRQIFPQRACKSDIEPLLSKTEFPDLTVKWIELQVETSTIPYRCYLKSQKQLCCISVALHVDHCLHCPAHWLKFIYESAMPWWHGYIASDGHLWQHRTPVPIPTMLKSDGSWENRRQRCPCLGTSVTTWEPLVYI